VDIFAAPLGVAHLAKYSAVGTAQALYGKIRTIGIVRLVQGGLSVRAGVTEGNLSVFEQRLALIVMYNNAALAVAYRNQMNRAGLFQREPG